MKKLKGTGADLLFEFVNYTLITLGVIIIVIPLLYVVSTSLVSFKDLSSNSYVIIPTTLDFSSYQFVFQAGETILNGFLVSLFRVTVGTALNLLATAVLAYALTKKDMPGSGALTLIVFFTMLFTGGMIPTYVVVRLTGLTNTLWSYIIPGLVSVWNVLMLRTFFDTIPESLEEAAIIDGAGQATVLFRVILPLSTAGLVTVGLFYAVGHWNSWFDAQLYVGNRKLYPIQMVLKSILDNVQIRPDDMGGVNTDALRRKVPPRSLQMATLVITTVPIVCVYPFLQKYLVKGVMVGAIKG